MSHHGPLALLLAALIVALAAPAAAELGDGELQRATEDLERARAEAGAAGEALAAGRAEEARLRAELEALVGEVAAAEVRYGQARRAARERARSLYVTAGDPSAALVGEGGVEWSVRLAYAAAVADRDQEVVNTLGAAAADRERWRRHLETRAGEQADLAQRLERLAAEAGEDLAAAEAKYARVRAAWEAQEARRQALAAAAATTTTHAAPPSTTGPGTTLPTTTIATTTTTTVPSPPPVEGGVFPASVERWRPLVSVYFAADVVDQALAIITCESYGDPDAVNPASGAAGLFQHLPRYWPERAAAAGFPDASPLDPEANIAAAAWLVAVSVESGLPAWYFWSCQP